MITACFFVTPLYFSDLQLIHNTVAKSFLDWCLLIDFSIRFVSVHLCCSYSYKYFPFSQGLNTRGQMKYVLNSRAKMFEATEGT